MKKDKPEVTIERLKDALMCIDWIAMHQEDFRENLQTEKEREMHDALMKIFRISHTSIVPSCFHAHEEWEDEFQETLEIVNKA